MELKISYRDNALPHLQPQSISHVADGKSVFIAANDQKSRSTPFSLPIVNYIYIYWRSTSLHGPSLIGAQVYVGQRLEPMDIGGHTERALHVEASTPRFARRRLYVMFHRHPGRTPPDMLIPNECNTFGE